MDKGIVKGFLGIFLVFVVLKSCINCTSDTRRGTDARSENTSTNTISPLTKVAQKYKAERNFSVILYDMDTKNPDSSNPQYLHQYQVVVEKQDTVIADVTEWYPVSDQLFNKHVNDLGMEILSKKNGILHQEAAPAGYSNYVGNEQYGHWVERDGGSFWEFYGKYAFMSSMFNLATYPVRRAYWDDYYTHYYGRGSYYGPTGRTVYGTSTYANTSKGKTSTWAKKPSTFKSKVRDKVARSSSASSSRSYSPSSSYRNNKVTRSSSRSSSRSSFRSRSGGFGK